ncbi:Voltage-gated hydrogen channel 1 [Mactra antiquata]
MPTENRCSGCKVLYSLAAECSIVTLTLIHVIMSAVEILIHLDVIHVPNTGGQDTTLNSSQTLSQQQPDPGGCQMSTHPDLDITIEIMRYATLIVSALFIIEMTCKVIYLNKQFFKDCWQIFDLFIVILSIGVEISFFLIHKKLYCFQPATEAATFIIIFRLWRIPRACNVRKKELKRTYDNEIRYNTQTKVESEKAQKQLEKRVDYLETILRNNNLLEPHPTESGQMRNGMLAAAQQAMHSDRNNKLENNTNAPNQNDTSDKDTNDDIDGKRVVDLDRNDSDKASGGNDSGIEVKDSFRSDKNVTQTYNSKNVAADDEVFESDGSEINARIEQVEVQIEEISRQKQLPSISSTRRSVDEDDDVVLLRNKRNSDSAAYFVNPGFETQMSDVSHGSITYRSAEGIPTTEL